VHVLGGRIRINIISPGWERKPPRSMKNRRRRVIEEQYGSIPAIYVIYGNSFEIHNSRILGHPIKEGKMGIRKSSFFANNRAIQADLVKLLIK
jgi:hypothetical protein